MYPRRVGFRDILLEAMAGGWIVSPVNDPAGASIETRLSTLGRALEPDFLLFSADGAGQMRLRAGVLCFPSSWALQGLNLMHRFG
jgi:hypothetical protein